MLFESLKNKTSNTGEIFSVRGEHKTARVRLSLVKKLQKIYFYYIYSHIQVIECLKRYVVDFCFCFKLIDPLGGSWSLKQKKIKRAKCKYKQFNHYAGVVITSVYRAKFLVLGRELDSKFGTPDLPNPWLAVIKNVTHFKFSSPFLLVLKMFA